MHTTRVLVLDDSEIDATIIRDVLITQEYDVEILDDPRVAYDHLTEKGEEYDLLIFDVNLPGLDGVTLTKRLRNQGVIAPVLLLSGGVAPEVRRAITMMGPTVSFLEKGGDDSVLLSTCSDLLSRNQLVMMVFRMDAKLDQRLDSIETTLQEKIPTPQERASEILQTVRQEFLTHCPETHEGVMAAEHVVRDQSLESLENRMEESLHESTEELKEAIQDATSVSTLFKKVRSDSMMQVISGLMGVIFLLYAGFGGYSYRLADRSSRDTIKLHSDLAALDRKIDRKFTAVETALEKLVREKSPTPSGAEGAVSSYTSGGGTRIRAAREDQP